MEGAYCALVELAAGCGIGANDLIDRKRRRTVLSAEIVRLRLAVGKVRKTGVFRLLAGGSFSFYMHAAWFNHCT